MAKPDLNPWRESLRLSEVGRGTVRRRLEPDEAQRAALARQLGLDGLKALSAEVKVAPWLDGAQIDARFSATLTQTCGVTLEPFDSELDGDFRVRVLPPGSPHAPGEDPQEIDPDADDPPDVLEGESVDLAGYVIEHLALEIDPFPRKPGAVFEPPAPEEEASPFAALKTLKSDGPAN